MLADPRVTYNQYSRGYQDGTYRWMPGLDETVDAILVPAHHAMAGTDGAFLPHTQSGKYKDFQINGQSVGEMGIEACFAAHWGIPVIMMHGDEAACNEATRLYPWIVAVCVKTAVDHDRCTGPGPNEARQLVADGIHEAINKLRAGTCQPFAPDLPMTIAVTMRDAADAEVAAQKPSVERVDEFTVQGRAERHGDVMKWLSGTGLDMPDPT
jgi:D-amino peptidase